MRAAIITVCSASRAEHVRGQQRVLRSRVGADVLRVLVWLDAAPPPSDSEIPEFAGAIVLHVPPGPTGLRLAAGRNTGAAAAIAAGAELLVLLDADCIAGPELVDLYSAAALAHPGSLLCGPVTYLPKGLIPVDDAGLDAATRPHAARPAPPRGEIVPASPDEFALFWSLSFAVTATTWQGLGGFHERYEGYGGEDTDFAFTARREGVGLAWVGGAHAYHQHHPTSSPPWQHLDDILRNGALFASRWGAWPMEGWLERFAEAGAIVRTASGWDRATASSTEPDPLLALG